MVRDGHVRGMVRPLRRVVPEGGDAPVAHHDQRVGVVVRRAVGIAEERVVPQPQDGAAQRDGADRAPDLRAMADPELLAFVQERMWNP